EAVRYYQNLPKGTTIKSVADKFPLISATELSGYLNIEKVRQGVADKDGTLLEGIANATLLGMARFDDADVWIDLLQLVHKHKLRGTAVDNVVKDLVPFRASSD